MKTKTCHECKHGGGSGAEVLCKIMWFLVPAEVAESCASFEPKPMLAVHKIEVKET